MRPDPKPRRSIFSAPDKILERDSNGREDDRVQRSLGGPPGKPSRPLDPGVRTSGGVSSLSILPFGHGAKRRSARSMANATRSLFNNVYGLSIRRMQVQVLSETTARPGALGTHTPTATLPPHPRSTPRSRPFVENRSADGPTARRPGGDAVAPVSVPYRPRVARDRKQQEAAVEEPIL